MDQMAIVQSKMLKLAWSWFNWKLKMVNLFTLSSQENRFLTPRCVLQDSKIHLLELVWYYTTLISKLSARKRVTLPHSNAYSLPQRIILSNLNGTRRNVEVFNGHQEGGWKGGGGLDRENWPWSGSTIIKNDHFSEGEAKLLSSGAKHYNLYEHEWSRGNARDYAEFFRRAN